MGYVPNILNEAKMFEWAGISLGEETWFLISKAVKVFLKERAIFNRNYLHKQMQAKYVSGAKFYAEIMIFMLLKLKLTQMKIMHQFQEKKNEERD